MKLFSLIVPVFATCLAVPAQRIIRETPTPSPTPFVPRPITRVVDPSPTTVPVQSTVPANSATGPAIGSGNVYRNSDHRFEIRFPAGWQITGDDTGEYLRAQGFDLSLRAPDGLDNVNKVKINRALKNVTVLLTAFRSTEGTKDGAVLRISVEDLTSVPEVKDAVDYFDLMRSQFGTMKLPTDFKYSETQAEKLGSRQFAFLDTSTSAGKKRLYATVRGRNAIMFTLSYRTDEDLRTMRQILASGDFNIK
jgi:hypothetical protein